MSTLLTTLGTAGGSLSAYEQTFNVLSNNTTNSTTEGYANQEVDIRSASDANGSISAVTIDTRDAYAEHNVQAAQGSYIFSSTTSSQLTTVQSLFDLNTSSASDSGIGGSLNQLFASFSQLSDNPNNSAYRQAVLTAAGTTAAAFNATETGLENAGQYAVTGAQSTVSSINTLVSQIQQINVEKRKDATANSNPNVNAQLYGDLEDLSKLVNFTTIQSSDGTVSVYMGGQHALLVGTTQISLNVGTASNKLQITDSDGHDVTPSATSGQLGGYLSVKNTLIPSYQTQLNTLASALADKVNTQLQSGVDQNGNAGTALFSYSSADPSGSLAVTSITTSQIAAASSGNAGGNDNATAISDFSTQNISTLGNSSFSDYYGNLEAAVGTDSSQASNDVIANQQLLSQAQTARSNTSGVSLDQEAALLTEYQNAYDATSKLIGVLATLVQTAINLIPSN